MIAQFRFPFNLGLYLYHSDHLGSFIHVRSKELHGQIANGVISSIFDISILKQVLKSHSLLE